MKLKPESYYVLIEWLKILKYYDAIFDWKNDQLETGVTYSMIKVLWFSILLKTIQKEMEIKDPHKLSIEIQLCVEEFKLKTPILLLN